MTEVSYTLAFIAGILSFLSPCVLPLIPSYVTYITGMSFEELTKDPDRARVRRLTMLNSIAFILGFSTIFIVLGASSSLLGQVFRHYQDWIRIGGGILVILFGLFIMDIFKFNALMRERKFELKGKPSGYFGTFIVGVVFAAGWTPCIGPILGGILIYAGSTGSAIFGFKLLAVYSFGLALPFFFSALAINTFLSRSKKILKYMKPVKIFSGIILVAFGILLLLDKFTLLASYFPDFGLPY